MPGKVNPTQCEAVTMVCAQVGAFSWRSGVRGELKEAGGGGGSGCVLMCTHVLKSCMAVVV